MSAYTDAQSAFFYNLCRFGLWLEAQGYEVGGGESWRPPEQAALNAAKGKGIAASLHIDRMAVDLVIRKAGVEVGPEDYTRAGAAWKALDDQNAHGGDFKTLKDYQHFSRRYGGRA
jgi:hypothetical protein